MNGKALLKMMKRMGDRKVMNNGHKPSNYKADADKHFSAYCKDCGMTYYVTMNDRDVYVHGEASIKKCTDPC